VGPWETPRRPPELSKDADECLRAKAVARRDGLELLLIVSMKEAVVVKRVRGVSPGVIAVLPGEAGRVKRRIAQGLAGAGVLALDAAGRVWQWVRGRGPVEGGEQRSSLYRLIVL